MTDSEILLAMSTMLDPIRDTVQEIRIDLNGVKSDLNDVKSDLNGMKSDLIDVKFDLNDVKAGLKEVENRVKKIEITQEHTILPRLSNIESCYVTTYERYKNSVDDYESIKQDLPIIKQVLQQHSIKLQSIS